MYAEFKILNTILIESISYIFLFQKTVFPNADVIKLLIECGIDVNTKNEAKSTPLHVACQPYNYDNEVSFFSK